MTDPIWMSGARIAFVTYPGLPGLAEDDRLAIPAFASRGARVQAVCWDDPRADWSSFDLVLIRSAWDYTERPQEFLAWLRRMEAEEVPLWNPPGLAAWNADKRYLRELGMAGVPVVPTRWVEPGEGVTLPEIMRAAGWARAVVKPVVSANARDTWTATGSAADQRRFDELAGRRPVMVQPFLDEIAVEGEWSLVFFGGELSHAALKRPAAGDFRVQEAHGGTTRAARPDAATVAAAAAALDAVPFPWLYARVDGVRIGGAFHVMELEMLEPSLFLAIDPEGAPARFADAALAMIGGTERSNGSSVAPWLRVRNRTLTTS